MMNQEYMEYAERLRNESTSRVRATIKSLDPEPKDVILILAGGDNARWNGVKKYNLDVNGEPVLSRTLRLCKEFRPDAEIRVIGPEVKGKSHQDVFLKVYNMWSRMGNTYLMFGDVSWMKGTLRKFLSEKPTEPKLYGRPHGNKITRREDMELFGGVVPFVWKNFMWKVHWDALSIAPSGDWWSVAELMIYDEKTRNKLTVLPQRLRDWTWYHVMRKRGEFFKSRFFVDVGESVTDDFDYPQDYPKYCEWCGPMIDREDPP